MKFNDRFEFVEWLGGLLNNVVGDKVEDICSSENQYSGLCEIDIEFKDGSMVKMDIKMFNKENDPI